MTAFPTMISTSPPEVAPAKEPSRSVSDSDTKAKDTVKKEIKARFHPKLKYDIELLLKVRHRSLRECLST